MPSFFLAEQGAELAAFVGDAAIRLSAVRHRFKQPHRYRAAVQADCVKLSRSTAPNAVFILSF